MAPIEVKTMYDSQLNVMITFFSGTIGGLAEIETITDGIVSSFEQINEQRLWFVSDFTGIISRPDDISTSIIVRKIHPKLGNLFKKRTLGRVVVAKQQNYYIKTFVSLLGAIIGKKAHVCETLEQALAYIEKQKQALKRVASNS